MIEAQTQRMRHSQLGKDMVVGLGEGAEEYSRQRAQCKDTVMARRARKIRVSGDTECGKALAGGPGAQANLNDILKPQRI